MLSFIEPIFLSNILLSINTWMNTNNLTNIVTFRSDNPVFLYPLLLIVLYVIGIHASTQRDQTKATNYKHGALYLFTCAIGIFIVNYIIKAFFQRPRPYKALDLPIPTEELSLSNIPTDSFPSDHAAMAATIAMGLYLRGKRTQNVGLVRLGYFFGLIALVMGIGRIAIAIHRPTDIIVGYIVGITVAYFILSSLLSRHCQRARNWLIGIEERIVSRICR